MKRKLSPRALYSVARRRRPARLRRSGSGSSLVSPKRARGRRARGRGGRGRADRRRPLARAAATAPHGRHPADRGRRHLPARHGDAALARHAGILLELARIAEETGIEFKSITPRRVDGRGQLPVVPIDVAFDGNFYELSDFLFRLRTLVGVRRGELHAAGRLFSVETSTSPSRRTGFPELTAQPDARTRTSTARTLGASALPAPVDRRPARLRPRRRRRRAAHRPPRPPRRRRRADGRSASIR